MKTDCSSDSGRLGHARTNEMERTCAGAGKFGLRRIDDSREADAASQNNVRVAYETVVLKIRRVACCVDIPSP
jgi:hypothetical protein